MPLNPVHGNDGCVTQAMTHGIPEGVPLSSPELWVANNPRVQPLATNTNFPEIQLFISPYETDLYSNIMN